MKVLLVFSILIVFIKCLPFFTYDQVLNQVKVSTDHVVVVWTTSSDPTCRRC